jgi:hypothetical protein
MVLCFAASGVVAGNILKIFREKVSGTSRTRLTPRSGVAMAALHSATAPHAALTFHGHYRGGALSQGA